MSFKLIVLVTLFSINAQAQNSCSNFLKARTFIGTFVTLNAFSVTLDLRSEVPGQFNAYIMRPLDVSKLQLKAYFKSVELESRFMNLRHPKAPDLNKFSISGRIEDLDGELVIIFDRIWKKSEKIIFEPIEDSNILNRIDSFTKRD